VQHSAEQHSAEQRSAEWHFAEWHSAEWHSAECSSAECLLSDSHSVNVNADHFLPSVTLQNAMASFFVVIKM
jgi:hypothetical protein